MNKHNDGLKIQEGKVRKGGVNENPETPPPDMPSGQSPEAQEWPGTDNILIHDEHQVKQFHSLLPPLKDDEVYFLSLSARNKYLTQEEREVYGLSRTEMFGRSIARDESYLKYRRVLDKLSDYARRFRTKTEKPLPQKALICYANLHASSTAKAARNFLNYITDKVFESLDETSVRTKFKYLDREFLTQVHKANGTRKYVDVDFDTDYSWVRRFLQEYDEKAQKPAELIISTKGGYHVLLEKDQIGFDFHSVVRNLNDELESDGEIVINGNAMVPLPGTFQGEHPVKFVEKEK